MNRDEIRSSLERLAGQKAPFDHAPPDLKVLEAGSEDLGYSQLNDLLLLFGFDRITHSFFRFLLDGELEYERGQAKKFKESDPLKSHFRSNRGQTTIF